MDNADFTTVFDVASSSPHALWFPLPGIAFMVLGLFLPRLIDSGIFNCPPWFRSWFPSLFLGFAFFWTVTSSIVVLGGYMRDRDALAEGKASYVEGAVQNFIPMPVTGHAMESFTVEGVSFRYSDYVITSGFNNTASHGGPIRKGLKVRIWYVGNDILRLQVKK